MHLTVNSHFKSKEEMLKKIVKLNIDSLKVTLSIKVLGYAGYFNLSPYTTQEGFTSLLSNGKHLPMLDADNLIPVRYIKLKNILEEKQKEHDLSNIYVFSDLVNSYRFICFSEVSFKVFLFDIIGDCSDYLDWSFIRATVIRSKATLRSPLSNKIGRVPQKLIDCLQSYYVPIPLEKMEYVCYATSNAKKNLMILLGDKGLIKWRDNH